MDILLACSFMQATFGHHRHQVNWVLQLVTAERVNNMGGRFIDIQCCPVVQVWPGATHYPDFLKPNTTEWWTRQLQHMHDMVPIDGMWIDMNEASNFCEGEVCRAPTRSATSSLKYSKYQRECKFEMQLLAQCVSTVNPLPALECLCIHDLLQ